MKTNFTRCLRKLCFFAIGIVALSSILPSHATAQDSNKWSGQYGNEWIVDGQTYLRIPVNKKGIVSVALNTLPADFQANTSKLQIWHRGKQISILAVTGTEVLFFGVRNDGNSDGLLFRPTTARLNRYYTMFSTESAYFITLGAEDGLRANTLSKKASGTALESHTRTDTLVYRTSTSQSTLTPPRPDMNSYFENGQSKTGQRLRGVSIQRGNQNQPLPPAGQITLTSPFTFKQAVPFAGATQATVRIMVHSRNNSTTSKLKISVIPGLYNSGGTPRLLGTEDNDGFKGRIFSYSVNLSSDFDVNKNCTFQFQSSTTDDTEYYSIAFIDLVYEQNVSMQSAASYTFNFPSAGSGTDSRITVAGLPASGTLGFYDISDPEHPAIIKEEATDVKGDLMVTRGAGALTLYGSTEKTTGVATKVYMSKPDPTAYDYLILNYPKDSTFSTAVKDYATYRQSGSPGKKYKVFRGHMKDIYNQFNFGEPSPVAIRRFVDYMISDGNFNKFLLLVGKSISHVEYIKNEIPFEVPTIGFPGSDMLLVDSLGVGGVRDIPSIPVGRVAAVTGAQVSGYLDKIRSYEAQTDVTWRRNVIHVSGGKVLSEVNEFSGYLSAFGNLITDPLKFNGAVTQRKKSAVGGDYSGIEEITLAPLVNNSAGAGMITYFGHGSTSTTDLNFGYVSESGQGYDNSTRLPIVFYNGCGVNNIFSNLYRETAGSTGPGPGEPTSNGERPISLDWLLAPNKGAVIVFGNTWDAFASTSNIYLQKLYPYLFGRSDKTRPTIGEILRLVAIDVKGAPSSGFRTAATTEYIFNQANLHQVLLQGDPALRVLLNEAPLPVDLISFSGKLTEQSKVALTWETSWEKNNGQFVIERSADAKTFEQIGVVDGKGDSNVAATYSFDDNNPVFGNNYYRLVQFDQPDSKGVKPAGVYSRIISVNRPYENLWTLYPNPSSDFVDVKLESNIQVNSWNLIDMSGKIVRKNQVEKRINVSDLTPGTYILEIHSNTGQIHYGKFVRK